MKTNLKYLLVITASGLLLAGCCTSHQAKEWEYKIVAAGNANVATTMEGQEAILNDLGKQGWIFVQNEGGLLYFKRVKK